MRSTANGFKWSIIERLSTQIIQLIVTLYLARLLGPHVFGLVGMLVVFIAISQVFVDSGFSSALIRHTERTEKDFSTTFYFSIGVGITCYFVLFAIAPYVASFFEQSELINLLRVLGLTVIINSFAIVQRTKLIIEMDFKTQAKASLISVFISCGTVIYLANMGYGVWALVGQTVINTLCNVVFLNIYLRWFPTTGFSKNSFNYLFSFGSKLLIAGLLDTIFKNIYQIIIGKQFFANQVGFFTQANQLASVPAMTFTSVIQRVTYPMLSNIQNDTTKFDETYLLTLRMTALFIFPLMVGLSLSATPLITLILGEEWLPAAELLQIISLAFMLYPVHAINLNLLQVKGRSDIFLKLEVIKKFLLVCILFITTPLGIKAMCIGMVIQAYIAFFINSFYTGKFCKLNTAKQLKILTPIWLGVFICAILTHCTYLFIDTNAYIELAINLSVMPLLYIAFIRWMQPDLYLIITTTVFGKRLT
ncbi:lipopolysaccharide biosynthesis protein [Pseudoalteromonas sp. NZS11_1]|uniref:lipopolysaccharide biosynthesis protein n=1 Tax=Pseudoalteromonas sp. NZS11_1 TaxID=2792070 RepID=UPI0018CF9198|nr:lipopolysaccharide biosynthesis protein [Pseudoalteromonas sp. NZS11_1]MBH0044848.1 lipopolysaccharide biosynthesis protein [Pseudoalteromonas sp. NZS11_1]